MVWAGSAAGLEALVSPRVPVWSPAMGLAARSLVEGRYGWSANLAPVLALLEESTLTESHLWKQA